MAAAYLIGSLPFAILAGYLLMGDDIRRRGSGNSGATNVFRVLGWKAAVPVMIADFLKAFIPVYFAPYIMNLFSLENLSLSMFQIGLLFFLILGHVFPVWAKFRGGKGVATAAGGISALFPPAVPFCLAVFLSTIAISRYVSLASLLTAWSLPVYYYLFIKISHREFSILIELFFIVITILISLFHKSNIKRLIKKEELKIDLRKKNNKGNRT